MDINKGNVKEELYDILNEKLLENNIAEKLVVCINEDDVFKKSQITKITDYVIFIGDEAIENLSGPIGYYKNEHTIDFYYFMNTKSISGDYLKLQQFQHFVHERILNKESPTFYHGKLDSIETGETIETNTNIKNLRYYKLTYKFGTMIDRNYNPLAI